MSHAPDGPVLPHRSWRVARFHFPSAINLQAVKADVLCLCPCFADMLAKQYIAQVDILVYSRIFTTTRALYALER
jgi:hypothetical protein